MSESFFIYNGLVALGLGAILTWIGWRGRRVGDHPYCRKCGFDLTGRPDDSTRCSECGADLGNRRAVVIGKRKLRSAEFATGLILLFLLLTSVGIYSAGQIRGVDWQKLKPTWWLLKEGRSADAKLRDAAMKELVVRGNGGKFSMSNWREFVEEALVIQAHEDWKWDGTIGNVVEAGRELGFVTDKQWERYIVEGIESGVTLVFPSEVYRGESVKFGVNQWHPRVGTGSQLELTCDVAVIKLGDKTFRGSYEGNASGMDAMGWTYHTGVLPRAIFEGMKEGNCGGEIQIETTVTRGIFSQFLSGNVDRSNVERVPALVHAASDPMSDPEMLRQLDVTVLGWHTIKVSISFELLDQRGPGLLSRIGGVLKASSRSTSRP